MKSIKSTNFLLPSFFCVFALARTMNCFGDEIPTAPPSKTTAKDLRTVAESGDAAVKRADPSVCFALTTTAAEYRGEDFRKILQGSSPESLNLKCDEGATPLFFAARRGRLDMVQALIDAGADVNACGGDGEFASTPLGQANGHPDIEDALIDAGVQKHPRCGKISGRAVRLLFEKYKRAADAAPQNSGLSPDQIAQIAAQAADAAVKRSQSTQPSSEIAARKTATSDVDKPKYRAQEHPSDFAVIIGVEKYFNDLPSAQFAERDAQAVKDHLIALGYPERNIKFLTGQRATKSGIESNLETWLARNVAKDSTVFIYYSGHGAPDPVSGEAYLVPVDGDPELLQDTAYATKRLYVKLNALKAKRVIVALDSCFSGAGGRSVLAKGARPLVNKVDMGLGAGKITALTASEGNQISGTMEEQGHGAFTYYFLKGLNGSAADASGHVTVKGLYDYLVPQVRNAASRHNRDQTPQLLPASGETTSLILR